MSKKSKKRQIPWIKLRETWDDDSPDPRIKSWKFMVSSRKSHEDPTDPYGLIQEDEEIDAFDSLKEAYAHYKRAISRVEIVECDIQLHMQFGGYSMTTSEPFMPSFPETYIWLTRWRADGAFLESYHFNESKFGERETDKVTDELQHRKGHPGLRTYWVEESKKRIAQDKKDAEENTKKRRTNDD